ncbi:MAG: type II toxin-antitoxin system death-on-curing family toxin [bacterium]|nr:type II toxin-antitoxin system death-on-curing family toxin [bacterium]
MEDILYVHRREVDRSGGDPGIRDAEALVAAVAAPAVTHGGEYLLDLFDMAATYVVAIAVRQPFFDGNKRAATASALTFLYLNGYEVTERHSEELADAVLALLAKRMDREDLGGWFRERATGRGHNA